MNRQFRISLSIFSIIWLAISTGCGRLSISTHTKSSVLHSKECQTTLDEFLALKATFNKESSRARVNDYFSVLGHLSLSPGYILDYYYVLLEDFAGWPVLYVRSPDQTPIPDLTEEPFEPDSKTPADSENLDQYIQIDDSNQGYFEFLLLSTMGKQFQLFWHANYDDNAIICSMDEVEEEIQKHNIDESDPDFRKNAEKIDYEPKFKYENNSVEIQIIGFQHWGGLFRSTYHISRSFPHTILDHNDEDLVEWDIGIIY